MVVLIRYGELALKGLNRGLFEKKLVENIRACLDENNISYLGVKRVRGRILVNTNDKCLELKNVFGITSISFGVCCGITIDEIQEVVFPMISEFTNETKFRISTKRLHKIGLKSEEMNRIIGSFVVEKTSAKVSLKEFSEEIGIEIIEGKAYVYTGRVESYGGLPLGISGRSFAIIEDKRSIVGAWLIMKRGVEIIPIGLKEFDISFLNKYSYGSNLDFVVVDDYSKLKDMALEEKIPSVVVSRKIERDISEFKIPTLNPVALFTDDEILRFYDGLK